MIHQQNTFLLHRLPQKVKKLGAVLCLLAGLMSGSATAEDLTLNFTEADIGAVISAISEKTGKNFIVDPRVKGKVTVISHRSMDADEIYQVFLSILKVHGFAAIPGKNIIKIVPDASAKQDAIPTASGGRPGSGDELVTRIIEVKYVNAAQLVPILRPLVPQRGHLAAYPPSNVLIISDSAANIRRLVTIVSRIDQATSDELELIPLQHASATEIVRILTQLQRQDPKAKSAGARIKVVADDRTNSILLSGDKAVRLRIRAIISHLDTSVDVGGATQVVYLRYANAKDLVPVLTGVSKSLGEPKGKGQKTTSASLVSIQADESTNALVINAPPDVFRSIRSVIQRLDIRRAQVLVEAVIAEVTTEKAEEFGIQWAIDGIEKGSSVGIVNFSTSPILSLLDLDTPPAFVGLTLGVGDLTGTTRIAALIRALAADASTNILSTPTLVTLDNEEAEITVGQNVPFLTGSFSGTGGGSTPANPFQTIQRQDVGLTLKIKPQINEGNAIRLDVEQEISSVSESAQAVDLITNKRFIKTSVLIEDGQMLVLGGLVQDDLKETEQKVPGLGDIPLLGWLFRYQRTSKTKTNLMIFLHPTIIKDASIQANMTNAKYNYMRAKQLDIRQRGVALLEDEDSPLLPEIKNYPTLPPPFQDPKSNPLPAISGTLGPPPGDTFLE